MARPRRDAPLPRVVLCAALTVDGKLDPPSVLEPSVLRRSPWARWHDDPATRVWTEAPAGGADHPAALRRLARQHPGTRRVICLGGADRFRALLDAGVVSEILLVVRPRIDGRRDAATLGGPPGAAFFPASVACRLLKAETCAGECWLHYRLRRVRRRAEDAKL